MAVFEETPSKDSHLDDSARLFCTIVNSRNNDGHTEYILKVHRGYNEENHWTIFRRYSEFCALHKDLKAVYYEINLPPKKFFGNLEVQFVKDRQHKLQSYLNKVLDHIVLSSSYYLKRFLDSDNYYDSIQDNDFQNASMALRGKTDFHTMKPTPNIGWRFNKQYCNVKKFNDSRKYILTWISDYGIRRCLNDKETQSAFKVLLELSHPYIMPIIAGDCYTTGTLVIRSCSSKGSLREWICRRTPFDHFLDKCRRYRDESVIIPSNEVSTISIQVLHALNFLHKKNIPYGNLHTGNIFIEDEVAKISEVENGILGLPSFYKRFLIENRRIKSIQDVDVYCFGHVLYEMAFGERLDACFFDSEILVLDCYEHLRPVLRLLLSSSLETKLPAVLELLSSNAFCSGSSKIKFNNPPRIKITSQSKAVFSKCLTNIEDNLIKEQNELKKHKKRMRLLEEVEASECNINVEERRKSRRKSSQSNTKIRADLDQFENMSNCSGRTSLSTDSSSPNSGCDKTNETNNVAPKIIPDSSGTSPSVSESSDRSAFLQSIVNFNKNKLKKANSNGI
ncbi:PX domain-containing protein kinase-like protein [Planococcus citri]|uniref:PX domain-containing protein kinase-like protein n=1 Tax=Planococcus citri TaxID=170843 RepID=UPI0031FA1FA0